MIDLSVSEVRQWTFCPRVLWHRRVMPHRVRETAKMELGRDAEDALERLERRRTGRRYGLVGAKRKFGVALESARLGVRGTCDLMLTTAEGRLHPVDMKRTEGGASMHHMVQLAGYGMLLEETHGLAANEVDRGFILLLPSDELVAVPLGPDLRGAFERAVGEIRAMLEEERFPSPTRHHRFCPQCEYVRFCGDVL